MTSTLLVLKLFLTPVLIGGASVAQRMLGTHAAGLLVGLPLTAGPLAWFIAWEQGTKFASTAAASNLLGLLPLTAFCIAYAWSAGRGAWPVATVAGVIAYLVIGALSLALSLSLMLGFVLVLFVLGIARKAVPQAARVSTPGHPPAWDIPVRMLVATGIVLALTHLAPTLGPQLTGLLAPFPVFTGTLTIFTHRSHGFPEAHRLLRGVIEGSFAYAVFFLVLACSLPRYGVGAAFFLAVLSSMGCQFALANRSFRSKREFPPQGVD